MPPDARLFFEPRLGTDLSRVRLHGGAAAEQTADELNARAYTIGNHIVFGAGQYRFDTTAGRALLAHELVHVQQQYGSDAVAVIQRAVRITTPYDVKDDFDPAERVKSKQRSFGRTNPILNSSSMGPRLRASRFQNALRKPTLAEKNLDNIPRPDLSDPLLDPVRAGFVSLMQGHPTGRRVQLIQEALIAWGRGLQPPMPMLPRFGADGDFEDETLRAVTEFQAQTPPLAVDGIVGPETLRELQQAMNNLHGSIYSLDTVGDNNFRGLIHIPPPSPSWTDLHTTRDFVIDHILTSPLQKAQMANHFGKCPPGAAVRVIFADSGKMVNRILTHERRHEADQVRVLNAHLVPWDAALEGLNVSQRSFRAANRRDATDQIFAALNIRNFCGLSTDIVNEWIIDNVKFHSTLAGAQVRLSLSPPGCTTLMFVLRPPTTAAALTPPQPGACSGPGPAMKVTRDVPV